MSRRINVTGLRIEMGLTAAELAKRLGVHERSVWRWEAGEVEPSPLAFQQMRQVIGQHRANRTADAGTGTEAASLLTSGIPGPRRDL